MLHTLRTDPIPFQAMWDGIKTFELRKNDRGFKVGDTLCLIEHQRDGSKNLGNTGRVMNATVQYILENCYGLEDTGLCIMAITITQRSPIVLF